MNPHSKSCCFTGHRKIPSAQYNRIAERLRAEIIHLVQEGITFFYAGGALGFDTLAALTVLSLNKDHPHIKLALILPCPTQTKGWTNTDIETYEAVKARCDAFTYTSPTYTRGCMHARNRRLVDNTCVCLCYLTEKTGGTAYTVDYARQKGLQIINLA